MKIAMIYHTIIFYIDTIIKYRAMAMPEWMAERVMSFLRIGF